MPSLSDIVAEHTALPDQDHRWLKLLVSEWQLLADLSFSDLVLWVPGTDENVFWAAAQIRPTTGPTALFDDVVGDLIAYAPEHLVTEAFLTGQITGTSEGRLSAGLPVDTHAIPVRVDDRVVAVLEQHTSLLGMRSQSSLEKSYVETARELAEMVSSGAFPITTDLSDQTINPRVGDGFIRIDLDGVVEYASPNALSAYRRLGLIGDLVDENLAELTTALLPTPDGPVDESVASVLAGRRARRAEAVSGEAHLLLRCVPLLGRGDTAHGQHGAIVLCRDVSDLRRKERELVTKDATIREIHHRVKNNLQTVAALLRMQARRIGSEEARMALNDAMSRVASIAIVHETLSQTFEDVVDFDKVADGLLRMVADVAATGSGVSARRVGTFGEVSADAATSLSMVVTELCQNAVEHGLDTSGGEVRVVPERISDPEGPRLRVSIDDDGAGLPDGFDWRKSGSLGLHIVNTLVAEMSGRFTLGANPAGSGTRAVVEIPLRSQRARR